MGAPNPLRAEQAGVAQTVVPVPARHCASTAAFTRTRNDGSRLRRCRLACILMDSWTPRASHLHWQAQKALSDFGGLKIGPSSHAATSEEAWKKNDSEPRDGRTARESDCRILGRKYGHSAKAPELQSPDLTPGRGLPESAGTKAHKAINTFEARGMTSSDFKP